MARLWDITSTHGMTLLDEQVTQQARVIADIDDFKLMLVLAIGVLPLLLLVKTPSPQ